jgi:hypothetical protein
MEKLADLFAQNAKLPKKTRRTERGDLLDYFTHNANLDRDGLKYKKLKISFMAWKLQGLKVKDLYYLKSVCEQERRRGGSWSKAFWGSLKG